MKYVDKLPKNTDQPIQAKGSNANFQLKDYRKSSIVQRKQVDDLNSLNTVQLKSEVIQLMTDDEIATSMRNVAQYSSLIAHYGEATVKRVLKAANLHVRGHASGGAGDGMNAATTKDLEILTAALKKDAATAKGSEARSSYGAGAAAAASSSSGKHQNKEQKAATDASKKDKSDAHSAKKHQDWLDKEAKKRG